MLTLTPGSGDTVSKATVETTSTSVATHPPWRVPYLFCTLGVTGNTHTHRPGSRLKSCAGLGVEVEGGEM